MPLYDVLEFDAVLGVLKTSLGFSDSYSKIIQNQNQQREKALWDDVQRKPGRNLQKSSPHGVTEDAFNYYPAPNCDNTCEMSNQGSSLETQCPKFLLGSRTQSLPSTYQNSRLPEEKEVLNINHIVWTNSWSIVHQPYQLWNGGNTPRI